MFTKIHKSHIGVEGCLRREHEKICWAGIKAMARDFISHCEICKSLDDKQCIETLMSHGFPAKPQRKGCRWCYFYSWWWRLYVKCRLFFKFLVSWSFLPRSTLKIVIKKLKAHFARYRIPSLLVSDSGPQLSSDELANFSPVVQQITNSP